MHHMKQRWALAERVGHAMGVSKQEGYTLIPILTERGLLNRVLRATRMLSKRLASSNGSARPTLFWRASPRRSRSCCGLLENAARSKLPV